MAYLYSYRRLLFTFNNFVHQRLSLLLFSSIFLLFFQEDWVPALPTRTSPAPTRKYSSLAIVRVNSISNTTTGCCKEYPDNAVRSFDGLKIPLNISQSPSRYLVTLLPFSLRKLCTFFSSPYFSILSQKLFFYFCTGSEIDIVYKTI